MKTLTLVVTYNEAPNIRRLIPAILDALPDTMVLVVDDDSPDGTSAVVQDIAERDPRVAGLCRKRERGYGTAMLTGLRHALDSGVDAILTLDADFSHDPGDLPRLLQALAKA